METNQKDPILEKQKSPTAPAIGFNPSNFISERSGSYNEDYKLGGVLGTGAFAEVRKVTNRKTKVVRAMKVVEKKKMSSVEEQKKFMSEIQILKQLDHPNILKLYEFYQDAKNYYIIIELCTGGELFDKIIEQGTISEKEASYIMKQLLSAIVYAHKNKVAHRDLKPENILLDITSDGGYNIKVIDWGTAKVFDNEVKMTDKFGTPYYIAPEVLKKEYNEKCDVWSCGVILYILLSGTPPFPGKNDREILKNVAKGTYTLETEEWKFVTPEAKDLINQMLMFNPDKRINVTDALKHPWFDKVATQEKVNKDDFQKNMKNLKNFRAEQKLQQAAYTFIASQLTSKEEKQQLLNTFKELDANGDGSLSREEILTGYKQIMGDEEAEVEVAKIMDLVDMDKSGSIDYTEFIAATLDRKKLTSKERLVSAFNLFDRDGNGFIEANELKEVLGGQLNDVDEVTWEAMIKEVDTNGDGVISFDEFAQMMLKYVDG
jgi:calcium-dependent protein kinase